jgi:uncharacterized protein GlcG (DUF336 family)
VERLEEREVPATFSVNAGVLTVVGTPQDDRITIATDATATQLVVQDNGRVIARLPSASITGIQVFAGEGNDRVQVTSSVRQTAVLDGGNGKNTLIAGSGPTTLIGGTGNSKLGGGSGSTTFIGGSGNELLVGGTGGNTGTAGAGANKVINVNAGNTIVVNATSKTLVNAPPSTAAAPATTITAEEVRQLLLRANAATASNDAIIAIVDRNGRVLGIRLESGVASNIVNDQYNLVFAIDGALAKARTAAFFASNAAPLTSRTINDLSQSNVTQREVEGYPSIVDPNSTLRGPGYVAPVRTGAHFPPSIPNTPEVDLFGIEHTNRDSIIHPGADSIKGTADDVVLPGRFNVKKYDAGKDLFAPESYGLESGLQPQAQARGIATLPGGIPLFKNGELVGGIGVFFPGKTGFATEENSVLSAVYDPTKPDRSFEAEYIAFAAAGGSQAAGFQIGTLGGVGNVPGFNLPSGRIDLVGIQLNVYGPGGSVEGPKRLVVFGKSLGEGTTAGTFQPINGGADRNLNTPADNVYFRNGLPVPDGWLVSPKDGNGVTAAEVNQIINNGIRQAWKTRAAIRLPLNSNTRMVFAVSDRDGNIVGLFRMPDATVFSIDVAVAKSRNVNYYADASKLQAIDQLPGIPAGTAFTNRTFRFLALPRYPSGAEGNPPGFFSIINDGGSSPIDGVQVGPRLPASAYQNSVYGHDSFYPNTNFHDRTNILNQNGIVFFPGSTPLYRNATGNTVQLIGGFGVSGDGVDQDDVVTTAGQASFGARANVLQADQYFFRGVRLPYQKFNRNPQGGIEG